MKVPIPQAIVDDVNIIPLHSHAQARRCLAVYDTKSIIYYLVPEMGREGASGAFDLYIYYGECDSGDPEAVPLMSKEEILHAVGQFHFRGSRYPSIEHLLRDHAGIRSCTLKQHIIARYFNSLHAHFTSSFFLTKGRLFPPPDPWCVYYPVDIIMGIPISRLRANREWQITMMKPSEFFFKNAETDFGEYLKVLSGLLGFPLPVTSIRTTSNGGQVLLSYHYWQIASTSYNQIISKATSTEVPSLKDLSFAALRRSNPFPIQRVQNAHRAGIPEELFSDIKFPSSKLC